MTMTMSRQNQFVAVFYKWVKRKHILQIKLGIYC